MDERQRAAELARLDVDYDRGAISADDYARFRSRLLGGDAVPIVAPRPHYPSAYETAQGTPPLRFASWGRRAAAKCVDGLVFVFAGIVAYLAAAPSSDPVTGEPSTTGVLVFIGFFFFVFLYPWVMTGSSGQTLGKRAMGIKVVRSDASSVSYGRALGRYLTEVLLGVLYLPLLLSYAWPLWDGRRQTLHDKMANTVVVRL